MRSAFVLGVLLLLLAPIPAGAQFVEEHIKSYDANITIQRNGTIEVIERIDYDFGSFPKHGIFRDIPVRLAYDDKYDRVFPLHVQSVTGSPGTPADYKTTTEGGLLHIRIGDPDKTITGLHTYTIDYEVEGALNGFRDHYELYWNALGTQWPVPVNRATVKVKAPATIDRVTCFAGPLGSNLECAEHRFDGPVANFSQSELNSYEGLTVVIALPVGSVVPRPAPILKERFNFARAFSYKGGAGLISAALLLLLLGWVGRTLWVNGRDRRAVGSPIDIDYGTTTSGGEQAVPLFESGDHPVEYGPPDGLRPGQVGTLMDEVANPLDVTATIVDLAVRGYLRIEEIPKHGIFGKPDWRLVKLKEADAELLRYETALLNGIFEDGDQVELSGLKQKFVSRLHKVQEGLYSDAAKNKWFAKRPDKVRAGWILRGIGLLTLGVGLTVLLAIFTHFALVGVPIVLAGLVMLAGAHAMPRRTPKGTGMIRRVHGFRTYIATAETREMQFQEKENIFSRYLPYAVVFGLTEKWAAAFAGLDDRPPDTSGWYVGAHPFTVGTFGHSIESFSTVTAGTIASTPGGSGGSGFSGGSSGGGGGGGGGGSW
ncbi:MAG TPA: DUF2207 domain-containing protein [Actinomycetota bacterium]